MMVVLLFGVPILALTPSAIPSQLHQSDQIRMETAPSGYYSDASGLTGDNLHAALYEIIRNHTVVSYSSAWTNLQTTDESPDDPANVTLFYTRRSHSENDTCGNGNTCTSDTWNRERVWPQSHGDFGT